MSNAQRVIGLLAALGLLTAACQPAATPAKPTEAPKAAAPAAPAPAAAPAASPAAAPAAAPAASPAAAAPAAPAAAPAASPAAAPATKPAAATFDAKAVEDFYKGKTIRIIVGFAAGGGYDTYARLISRHMGNHIPGNPAIVVENQTGAGSLLAANSVYKTAPKDGTVLAHFIGGMITQKLVVQNPSVEFDPMQYNWLGAPTPDTAACAVRKESGFTSLEEARTKQLILGGTAPGSTTDDIPNTLRAIGLNIKMVDGYEGTAKIRLAADSGEVMGGCWGWESILPTWKDALEKKEVLVLGQGGPKPHPDLQGVPALQSLAKSDIDKQLIEAGIVSPGQISRAFAAPPGVPAERVAALRAAFAETLADPALLDEAKKASINIQLVPPQEFDERIAQLGKLPADVREKLKTALEGK